jgi:hypothetical protein
MTRNGETLESMVVSLQHTAAFVSSYQRGAPSHVGLSPSWMRYSRISRLENETFRATPSPAAFRSADFMMPRIFDADDSDDDEVEVVEACSGATIAAETSFAENLELRRAKLFGFSGILYIA